MEPGIVVGYLVTFLLGGARRFADKTLDQLLSRLYRRVAGRLGAEPAFADLAGDPRDERAQRHARDSIAQLARRDQQFAAELTKLQRDLDQRGARNLVVHAPGAETVIGINKGVVVRHGNVYIDRRPVDPGDISDSPVWIKVVIALGVLLTVAGLGLFGYTLFTWDRDLGSPDFGAVPDGFGQAAAVFFAGFVLLALGSVGRAMTRRNPTRR